jgi:hypothetical protein
MKFVSRVDEGVFKTGSSQPHVGPRSGWSWGRRASERHGAWRKSSLLASDMMMQIVSVASSHLSNTGTRLMWIAVKYVYTTTVFLWHQVILATLAHVWIALLLILIMTWKMTSKCVFFLLTERYKYLWTMPFFLVVCVSWPIKSVFMGFTDYAGTTNDIIFVVSIKIMVLF